MASVPKVKIDGKSLQQQLPKKQIVNLSEDCDFESKNYPLLHLEHFDTNSSCPAQNMNEDSEDESLSSLENTRNRRLLQEAI